MIVQTILILTYSDVKKESKQKPVDDLELFDFKLSTDEMHYIDEPNIIVYYQMQSGANMILKNLTRLHLNITVVEQKEPLTINEL